MLLMKSDYLTQRCYLFGLDFSLYLDLSVVLAVPNDNWDQFLAYFFVVYLGSVKKTAHSPQDLHADCMSTHHLISHLLVSTLVLSSKWCLCNVQPDKRICLLKYKSNQKHKINNSYFLALLSFRSDWTGIVDTEVVSFVSCLVSSFWFCLVSFYIPTKEKLIIKKLQS
jgi:hypothetical protein